MEFGIRAFEGALRPSIAGPPQSALIHGPVPDKPVRISNVATRREPPKDESKISAAKGG